jgi:hypothetical protein
MAILLPCYLPGYRKLKDKGVYNIGGKHYKRVPRGYDPEHINVDLLLYNGLTVGVESEFPKAFYTKELVDYCMERYKDMAPVVNWLLNQWC